MSKKRVGIALLVGGIVFGAVFATAASLGGLTTDNLGADGATVASCDANGVTATWTSDYDSVLGAFEVTDLTIGGIDPDCETGLMEVALTGTAPSLAAPHQPTGVTLGTSATQLFTVSAANIRAEDVTGIQVVIDGSLTPTLATP